MNEWLFDEDAELLGATLSLVASWDTKEEEQLPSNNDADQAPQVPWELSVVGRTAGMAETTEKTRSPARSKAKTTVTARRPRRVNATRERRKLEIELLQSESAQLQEQLQTLQQRREEMLRPHFNGQAIQTTAPIWETMARRQFQSRRRTEEYNAKLKKKIQTQTLVAQELMTAIQIAIQRQSLREKRLKVRRPINASQHLSADEQQQRLDYNLPRWQWALSLSPKFQQGDLQFMDVNVATLDGWSATMDLCHSLVLPYAVDTVGELLRSFFQAETRGAEDDEDVDTDVLELVGGDELVTGAFSMDSTMGGACARAGTISGKWASKHCLTHGHDQRLISDQWCYELSDFGNELDGVSVVEDTWLRLVAAKEIGHTQLNGPVTVLQLVRRLQLNFNRSERVDRSHVKAVISAFKDNVKGKIQRVGQDVEDMLVAQALSRESSN